MNKNALVEAFIPAVLQGEFSKELDDIGYVSYDKILTIYDIYDRIKNDSEVIIVASEILKELK